MTEAEWLDCDEPEPLLPLRSEASDRKWRLLAVAAGRKVWRLMPDDRARRAVEVAERFADGTADEEERAEAEEAARGAASAAFAIWNEEQVFVAGSGIRYWSAAAAVRAVTLAEGRADEVIWEAGMALAWLEDNTRAAGPYYWAGIQLGAPWPHLIRDLFTNPFRPVRVEPAWRTAAVTTLAAAAYEERALPLGELDLARLAVLADALEEAGCSDAEILNHLRSPGPHVRGCWALDLILGRA